MKLIQKLAFGAMLLSSTAVAAQTIEGPKVNWSLSMWGNPRALSAGMEAIAEEIRTQTGGNFDIQIFYGGQLSSSRENLDGLKLNAFEGAAICNFYHPGKNPAWMVFSLPFLPLGDPAVDKYVRSHMFEHPAIVADMEAWNALPYLSGLLPQYEILGKGDAPTELSDWEGLRVRAGGGLGDAMEVLGAIKQTLPAGETSTAFQRGAVDAAAFPYTYAHVSFGISEEADWFTSNLAPGTSECGWVLNKSAYDALPEQYQTLLMDLRDMGMDVEQAAYAEQDEKNLPVFRENLTEIVYSDEQLAEFRKIAGQPVWDAWIAANSDAFDAQGVFDAIFEHAEEAQNQ
ncbi:MULTISPECIES: C4-dicarboxylate ABC transporter substrate-binding protein [Halocynthiibacter]|uniref:C4-dicarboxylate ABC transporter substrate-binding protein n=1 Tax=Halocynthiibacter halioticoli TaxID=2986804 RepID=A0AAE3J012_9RHOB|nr:MULTISPECIES: C4-dicarboxylate ABC transporter substrate-binding protein [Halocynthiibacter]MCV6824839.1 C4-dicarboxylate ABC transporter substrate-binding protein [Halocynthiibacter halioticoli]MCW4057840.1 C4-dicarboxylate ABC transporter substrate-binding protein [Halocynthiibacter sp. SDUM655004]